jgi:hypothetical protein
MHDLNKGPKDKGAQGGQKTDANGKKQQGYVVAGKTQVNRPEDRFERVKHRETSIAQYGK